MNLLEGMLVESGAASDAIGDRGPLAVAFPGGSVSLPDAVGDVVRRAGPEVVLGLRPEALRRDATGPIAAEVLIVELLGAETHVICHTENGTRIIVRQWAASARPSLGEAVRIAVDGDASAYHLFDGGSGLRLGSW